MERRPEIMATLSERGIGTSVYYPQPVPRMTYYQGKYGYDETKYPNATRISDGGIALPVGPHLDAGDMKIIADNLKIVIKDMIS